MNTTANPAPDTSRDAPQRFCPRCGSARVHRSHRKGASDRILGLFGARIRRCHDCRSRQAWFGPLGIPIEHGSAPATFLTQAAVVGGGFLICLLLLWWMISRFSSTSS